MLEQASNQTNEEIDLIELIRVLWKKKLLIAIVTFIFTALAAVYAFTAKEKWTSQAEVIAPRVTDISEYLSLRKEYNLIMGSEFKENDIRNELNELFLVMCFLMTKQSLSLRPQILIKNLQKKKMKQVYKEQLLNLQRNH